MTLIVASDPPAARKGQKLVVQVSRLPTGELHRAVTPNGLKSAVLQLVDHYWEHRGAGGYVGVVPVGHGYGVQLHAAGGEVESWCVFLPLR